MRKILLLVGLGILAVSFWLSVEGRDLVSTKARFHRNTAEFKLDLMRMRTVYDLYVLSFGDERFSSHDEKLDYYNRAVEDFYQDTEEIVSHQTLMYETLTKGYTMKLIGVILVFVGTLILVYVYASAVSFSNKL